MGMVEDKKLFQDEFGAFNSTREQFIFEIAYGWGMINYASRRCKEKNEAENKEKE